MKSQEFAGLKLFETKTFKDSRGHFRETFKDLLFEELTGKKYHMVQDNEAFSGPAFVLRGLHFQRRPRAQAKLVRVAAGAIFDAVVDLRRDSPSYGRWKGFELSAENGLSLFVPDGFAHGYLTLVENTVVNYKVSDYYAPETEGGLVWNDRAVNIDWPLAGHEPIVSDKDQNLQSFSELDAF